MIRSMRRRLHYAAQFVALALALVRPGLVTAGIAILLLATSGYALRRRT